MKLTGELKDKVESAENGIEIISEDMLDLATGGAKNKIDKPGVRCNKCGKRGWYGAMCLCGGTYVDC